MSESALTIVAVITGITGCIVAVLHTIKYSECCHGFFKFYTRSQTSNTPNTPNTPIPQLIMEEPHNKRRLPSPPIIKKTLIASQEV